MIDLLSKLQTNDYINIAKLAKALQKLTDSQARIHVTLQSFKIKYPEYALEFEEKFSKKLD